MKHLLILIAFWATTAHATNYPTSLPSQPSFTGSSTATAEQSQHQAQSQGAYGGAGGNGSGGSVTDQSRSYGYVFPAPVYATALPAHLCPKGDSLAWSIGWNFFS